LKQLFLTIVFFFYASMVFASSYWDIMIWDQDSWYKSQSLIHGKVITNVTGQKTGIYDARVSIIELGCQVQTDKNGNFVLDSVPDGLYTIKIETEYFSPVQINEVAIINGQANLSEIELFEQKDRFSQTQVDKLLSEERMKWDVDNDGKISLKEAIKALSISANICE